jgi:hypothetical protein
MQRAAATRGTDATAAEALDRLAEFRRRGVGADISTSRGPLRTARGRVAAAEAALREASGQHEAYLAQGETLEAAEHQAADARRQLAIGEALAARRAAADADARAARARTLAERHPVQPRLAERDEQADRVAAALAAWRGRPTPTPLDGPSALELEAALAAVPAAPQGDLQRHPSVTAAARELDLAEAASVQPAPPLAQEAAAGQPRPWAPFLAIGAFLAGSGTLAAVLLGAPLLAILLIVGAGALALGAWLALRSADMAGAERAAAALRLADWERQQASAGDRLALALDGLRDALAERGEAVGDDPREALAAYEAACDARVRQAAAASRGESLRVALDGRRALERSAAQAAAAVATAESGLRDAATQVGSAATTPEAIVGELERWQHRRADAAAAAEAAVAEWQELISLLGDRTLDDLEAEASRQAAHAHQLASSVGGDLPSVGGGVEDLGELRGAVESAQRRFDGLNGELGLMRRNLPSVAEAEEELQAARDELAGVEQLATTLDETIRFLRAAQERVHRDLAPILAAAVGRWLGVVSRGAYVEATVDPANLAVCVKEAASGQWREVRLLSEGTREQIYLLLRVAMAEHLTTGETAPLLLDEATSQSDAERKAEVLGVLHALSAERQVVLFSHDDDVEAWAERTLSGPQDRLIRLAFPVRPPRQRTFEVGEGVGDIRSPVLDAAGAE